LHQLKKTRPYDRRGRTEQAQSTRERIIDAASHLFLETGYGATTIAAIAARAKVSVESVYKGFGSKAGLVRAIHLRGLEGRSVTPAETRSDAASAEESDPRRLMDTWGTFVAEVAPLTAPILLLVRTAAGSDPELQALFDEIDQARLARMTRNARVLAQRGFLREHLTVRDAAEVMWTYTAPELYDLLVVRRRWSAKRFGAFVADALKASLLNPMK